MRPTHVVGRETPPYRVLVPARPTGSGLHRAAHRPPTGVPVGGARLVLSLSVLVAVPLLALNLRPAVTSVGAVLADIRAGTQMSTVLASVVVAAPVWCFAIGGALAYKLRARWGTSGTVSVALVVLAATLAVRVVGGPFVLLGGTVLACLAIAVLGTLLPVITHAAPTKAWALLTGCYVAAMGGGSGIGALITPQVSARSTWEWGVSGWALMAAAAFVVWRVAARRFTEPKAVIGAGPRPSPFSLRPAAMAWSTTFHFGLTSGFTFTIMGWLPSILLDHSHVDAAMVGWMFTVAMALGVPIALMVPKWARAAQSQSALAIALCAPNLLAMGGLLLYPQITPWVWAVSLGLGMPAVGLALTLISLRAAPDGDTAAALSSMVQGFGYAIAGVTALAAGLLHSSTDSWEWPLIGLMVVLCGQLVTGMHAGLPTTVYSQRRPDPAPGAVRPPGPRPPSTRPGRPEPLPLSMAQSAPLRQPVRQPVLQPSGPISLPFPRPQFSQPLVVPGPGNQPAQPVPVPRPVPEGRQSPTPRPRPVAVPISQPLRWPVPQPAAGPIYQSAPEPADRESATQVVPESVIRAATSPEDEPVTESARPAAREAVAHSSITTALDPTAERLTRSDVLLFTGPEGAAEAGPVPAVERLTRSDVLLFTGPDRAAEAGPVPAVERLTRSDVLLFTGPERAAEAAEPGAEDGAGSVATVADDGGSAVWDRPVPVHPRQEALFDLPEQESLFEIPGSRATPS